MSDHFGRQTRNQRRLTRSTRTRTGDSLLFCRASETSNNRPTLPRHTRTYTHPHTDAHWKRAGPSQSAGRKLGRPAWVSQWEEIEGSAYSDIGRRVSSSAGVKERERGHRWRLLKPYCGLLHCRTGGGGSTLADGRHRLRCDTALCLPTSIERSTQPPGPFVPNSLLRLLLPLPQSSSLPTHRTTDVDPLGLPYLSLSPFPSLSLLLSLSLYSHSLLVTQCLYRTATAEGQDGGARRLSPLKNQAATMLLAQDLKLAWTAER